MSGSCNILFLTVWSLSRMKVQNAQPNLYILVKMSVEKYVIKWYIIGYLSLLWCCILLLSAVKSIFELITLSFWTANSIFSFIFLVFVTLHKNAPVEKPIVTYSVLKCLFVLFNFMKKSPLDKNILKSFTCAVCSVFCVVRKCSELDDCAALQTCICRVPKSFTSSIKSCIIGIRKRAIDIKIQKRKQKKRTEYVKVKRLFAYRKHDASK